ncbi:MAG: EpsG family protein [Oscillospiraceae bacterium]|jgi:hypothetical protein|nr:EpsG family protein [Oscillospiraceae bacterium]
MVRLIILGVLLALSVYEWLRGPSKAPYWIALGGLFAFFSLRYGQGQDYLNYLSIYATVKPLNMLPNYFLYSFNKIEIGFFYLISFMRMCHVHFSVFVALLSGGSLLMIDRFIRKFSPLPVLSLTCFFAVYSLTYMESGLRQLIALCLMLGWALPDWLAEKRLRSALVFCVAATMHASALLALAVLLVFFHGEQRAAWDWKLKWVALCTGLVLIAMLIINFVNLTPILQRFPEPYGSVLIYYLRTARSFSLLALANRLIFLVIIGALTFRARDRLTAREWFLVKFYAVGFLVYLTFMSVDLIASRTNVYFRIVEFALLPALLYRNRDLNLKIAPAFAAILAMLGFIYIKDVRAIMDFGQYFRTNPTEYPYITILKPAELMEVRYIPVKFEPYMNQAAYGQFDFVEYYRRVLRKPSITSQILPY